MRKVVLRTVQPCTARTVFYTTEKLQDDWSEMFIGSYTDDLSKAKTFSTLESAFGYIMRLPDSRSMLAIEPVWLDEVEETVVTQVVSRIE